MRLLLLAILLFSIGCSSGIQYPEGGYNYPKNVEAKDTNFYYYPLKNTLSRKDSFNYGREYKFWEIFSEPNLSLRPLSKEIFRFVYAGWARRSYIISLTEDTITIKSGNNALVYEKNEQALTLIEQAHLGLFRSDFPLNEHRDDACLQRYLDSMIKAYPQLLDPKYYQLLEDKSYTYDIKNLDEKITRIALPKEKFKYFVDLFNASGYWKLPFHISCDAYPTDGDGFSLEANTKKKYNIVTVDGCSPGDTTKLAWACQQLVEFVHLEKEIRCFNNYKKINGHDHQVIVKDVQLEEIKDKQPKKKHSARRK